MRISAAICTVATMSSTRARNDDAERLDLVDAGVGAVELARSGVEAHLAGDVLAQVPGQGLALLFDEGGHDGMVPGGAAPHPPTPSPTEGERGRKTSAPPLPLVGEGVGG